MKRLLYVVMSLLFSIQGAFASVDSFMEQHVSPISDAVANIIFYPIHIGSAEIPIIIFWILIAGLFFTFYLKGIAFWGVSHSIDILTNKHKKKAKIDSSPVQDDATGEVSAFQALMTALSGTIGLGAIAGVAIAISLGGPGAAFWIIVGSILGMSLKFVEAALAVKYRRFNLDGSISGGPMHYMAHGLTRRKMRWLGQPLAAIFAVLCICGGITGGNMIQINQAANQFVNVTGGDHSIFAHAHWVIGLVMAIVVGMIVIGGIKSIVKVTQVIVPAKIIIYFLAALTVILFNLNTLHHAIAVIVKQAFQPDAIYGGAFVAMIMGLRRSVQSNEAGTGSAPIAYATVKTKEHISQGFIALLEPLLTGFMCTMTALAVVISGVYKDYTPQHPAGIEMTSAAISTVMSWFPAFLSAIVILYALSTLISWAYYGQKSWNYLFGEGRKRTLTFHFIYCSFIIVGSVMNMKSVISITDAMMISMSIPNIIVMYILAPEIKEDLKLYCQKYKLGKLVNKKWLSEAKEVKSIDFVVKTSQEFSTISEEEECPTK